MPAKKCPETDRAREAWILLVRGAHVLACKQSRQREPCSGSCHPDTLTNPKGGKHPSPAPSTLQPGMRSHEIWAKIWSSHAETDGGAWGMIQVEPREPLSVRTPGGRWGLSGQHQDMQEHCHKSTWQPSAESQAESPGRTHLVAERQLEGLRYCLNEVMMAPVSMLRSRQQFHSHGELPGSSTPHHSLALELV